jgi:hypothetical protein
VRPVGVYDAHMDRVGIVLVDESLTESVIEAQAKTFGLNVDVVAFSEDTLGGTPESQGFVVDVPPVRTSIELENYLRIAAMLAATI